uniref:UBA domain-containing protein n=1 Tax=Leersia perrieri TaxID=77586 RepID=A0A0D9WD97_9ORYZ
MNASQFMDKQILGLAASAAAAAAASSSSPPAAGGGGGGGLFDLMSPDPQEEADGHARRGGVANEVVPSYDFQPIRAPPAAGPPPASAASPWGSLDSNSKPAAASSNLKSAGMLESHVLKTVSHEEERSNFTAVSIADIDRTMKKYADTLLHALEGVSSRLSQLEGRAHHLEGSVGELKLTIGNYNGSTDGKLRQFENTLREVQAGVQILRDKQEIVEAQVQLSKLQMSKVEDVQSEKASVGQADSRQQPTLPQPQHQAPPPSQPLALPALPAPNAPPPPAPQSQTPSQFPGHLPHSQVQPVSPVPPTPLAPTIPQESYYPPSAVQPTDSTHQQYQAPAIPQSQAPPAPPQHYQTPPQYAQYSQPPPHASANPPTAVPPSVPQQPEEVAAPYGPPQSYPPNVRPPPPYMPPPSGPAPPFYGPNPGMYEPPAVRPNSGPPPSYNTGYKPQGGGGFSEPYGYSGSPSHRGNAGMKPHSPFTPTGTPSGGSGNYGRLPTAQMLPQATPVSSSPSASSGNRVPMDDVVDKVATMGFSREQVRAAVRQLTENGQNVDLNMVLDKLMNGR